MDVVHTGDAQIAGPPSPPSSVVVPPFAICDPCQHINPRVSRAPTMQSLSVTLPARISSKSHPPQKGLSITVVSECQASRTEHVVWAGTVDESAGEHIQR